MTGRPPAPAPARAAAPAPADGSPGPVPGQVLLHPTVLVAVAVLVVNDHVLKPRFGNAVTGKVSDVAGLFFFPLVLLALLEWSRWLCRRVRWRYGRGEALAAVSITGAGFVAVKLVPMVGTAYVVVISGFRWMGESAVALASGEGMASLTQVQLAPDGSDVVALPVLLVSYLVAARSPRWHLAAASSGAASGALAGGGFGR